ncbi:unnamed protein product, partial [Angiostrongylus costaricensis]|uniref:PhoLip_ATPase_N domain-containing protein n=1 Tax=Angiostrongylus costaricensis TaxID=334426 RepID=A0A0R3PWV9_ANGCS
IFTFFFGVIAFADQLVDDGLEWSSLNTFTDGRLNNGYHRLRRFTILFRFFGVVVLEKRVSQLWSRMIQPNHMFDTPRYDLNNFRQFTDNSITTTKYSLLTFIPHNIFYQMCNKYANVYFLFIAVLNFCPLFGSYTKFLGLVPISFVLGTTLIKDGFEDNRRWRYDNKINTKTCHVWDRDRQMFRKMQWKHIIVGDFVHVSNEQEMPADVLFLREGDCMNSETMCLISVWGQMRWRNRYTTPHLLQVELSAFRFIVICMVLLVLMVVARSLMFGIWSNDHSTSKKNSSLKPDPFVAWNSPKPVLDSVYNVGAYIICFQVNQ